MKTPNFSTNQIAIKRNVPYSKSNFLIKDVKYRNDYISDGTANPTKCLDNSTDFPDPNLDILCDNNNASLFYDVYYPNNQAYTAEQYQNCPLPCIIFFHGGSYSDCSNLQSNLSFAVQWAQRGFVVFNVEYRRGRITDETNNSYYSVQQILAFYRAFQDARGAIRSIIKRQNNETIGDVWNDDYRINTNAIFLAGASAGAAIAINAAYYTTQGMIDAIFPGTSSTNILGPIDINNYYGGITINYFPKIKGVLNMWGNAFVPYSFASNIPSLLTNYFNQAYLPPLISFHGVQDVVASFDYNIISFTPRPIPNILPNYNTEINCLLNSNTSYSVGGANTNPDLIGIGSNVLYDLFKSAGVFSELYVDCEMGHSLSHPGCQYFGLPSGTTETGANTYIMERAVTFFQAILINSNCSTISNLVACKFTECENFRFGSSGDNNNNCNNSDNCNLYVDPCLKP